MALLMPQRFTTFSSSVKVKTETVLHSNTDQQSRAIGPLLQAVKEYNTLKQIFDDNSEVITVGRQRVKAVDLKVVSTLFEDAYR